MGKYTRKCSKSCSGGGPGGSEVALMEVSQNNNSGSAKRRKVGDNGELRLSSSKSTRIVEACEGEDILDVSGDSSEKDDSSDPCRSSGEVPASCCSSNGSITEEIKCSDLEERVEIEIETTVRFNSDRRESTPTSELKEESGEPESSSTTESKPSVLIDHSRRAIAIPSEKTPPAAELEEFFASAEKNLHKSFKDKYNYDIVNDVPMKGRFEWVQLEP